MRDDADDLVGRLRLHQRAGVDEHAPAGNEGVEARIVDQHDVDAGFGQAGRLEDRPRVVAHQRLDLGVAHHRRALLRHRGGQGGQCQGASHNDRRCRAGGSEKGVGLWQRREHDGDHR